VDGRLARARSAHRHSRVPFLRVWMVAETLWQQQNVSACVREGSAEHEQLVDCDTSEACVCGNGWYRRMWMACSIDALGRKRM
jgi:hypothetical protein